MKTKKISLENQKIKLLELKKQIIEAVKMVDNSVDSEGDATDEVQANMLLALNNQLSSRKKEELQQIMDALNRVENKSYGLCEDCEEEIPSKRLEINPCFKICVLCAENREKEIRQLKKV